MNTQLENFKTKEDYEKHLRDQKTPEAAIPQMIQEFEQKLKQDSSEKLEQSNTILESGEKSTQLSQVELDQLAKEYNLDEKLKANEAEIIATEQEGEKKIEGSHGIGMSDALDLVPIVGGAKMVIESGVGKTMDGKKLSTKERVTYGTVGAGSIALDMTGVGAPEGEAMVIAAKGAGAAEKGSVKMGNVFKKLIEFMKKSSKEAK